jgi:hypothetical protein
VGRGDSKPDPRKIIRAQWRTYIDVHSGKTRWQDHLLLEGVPLAVFGGCLALDVRLGSAASAGLLTVAGLLSVFLFGVVVQMADRAIDLADSRPVPGPDTSAHAIYLEELAANASYASLVCITAAVVFVVASIGSHWVLRISSAIGLAIGAHLVLVLMMVMKRVFSLTQERLSRARTGADLANRSAGRQAS